MRADLYKRALRRAVEIAGGKSALATVLRVDSECIAKWTAGSERPPAKVMQSVAAVIKRELLKNYTRPAARRARR